MRFKEFIKRVLVLVLSLIFLVFLKIDLGIEGAIFFVLIVAVFIFAELIQIKSSLVKTYAEALTENKLILFFLENRILNYFVSGVFSLYFSFYLFVHVNTNEYNELYFFVFSGFLLSFLVLPVKSTMNSLFKELPAKAFSRLSVVFIVVLFTVILDGTYNAFLPVDSRVKEPFDIDIPLYVMDDIKHSYIYLQHTLRTALYLKVNVQSVALYDEVGDWFAIIRFFLLLSPTPYIAYALIYLSLNSIVNFNITRAGNNDL
ncbi:hypothetical protein [Amphritea japonica]|uniref:hypothetical protein n=2 Tax=Amphritea japonica TaxID=452627 RepID=UPI0012EA540E|nr:hypothetical protein [Amphritea japonica]